MSKHSKSYQSAELKQVTEYVKQQCIEAAKRGFHDASASGLCHEGALEAAISAIQMLNTENMLEDLENNFS